MKAISLKQPFASLIASGKKTIETRTWPTSYRGDVLIVSSKRPKVEPETMYPLGKALCIAMIVNCRPMTRDDEEAACCHWYPGAYAWELKSIRPIEPFAVRGSLGFYEVELPKNELQKEEWEGSPSDMIRRYTDQWGLPPGF